MKQFLSVICTALLMCGPPTQSLAQDVGLFGPEDDSVAALLLRQALDIADITEQEFNGQTRLPQGRPPEFDEFDLLREAYRTDPEATLDLIELILQAREAQ